MKKTGLLKLTLAVMFAGASLSASAQYNALLGPRLIVNEPAGLEGTKSFTYSSDPTQSGPWGRALDSTWYHVEVVKGVDSQACSALSNASAVNGKWVLIYRGDCYFGEKALNAQNAGAQGVIIVQNQPNQGPIGMAAAPSNPNITIPVLMVSNTDGNAMNAALNANIPVYISLTSWGFGFPNDLVLLGNSIPVPPYSAIPYSQLSSNFDSTVRAYNLYTGGYVANTGANDANNVGLVTDFNWTPAGSSTTTAQYHDSISLGAISTLDSVAGAYSFNVYQPNVNGKGTYTVKAYTSSADSDYVALDDTATASMEVTDSVFCMGRYNKVTGDPTITNSYKFNNGSSLTWGPLFYINNGKRRAYSVKFSVSDGDTTTGATMDGDAPVFVYLFKWDDNNLDSVVQGTELTLEGVATKLFDNTDTNNHIFTANFLDASSANNSAAYLHSKSWYWVAISAGTTYYIGADDVNYYGRLFGSHINGGITNNSVMSTNGDPTTYSTDGSSYDMFPFYANTATIDSVGLRSLNNEAPAVALNISKNEDPNSSVAQVGTAANNFTLYPNPAITDVHVKLNLAKQTNNMYINIADAMGRTVYKETLHNQQNQDLNFSTAKFAPGQYYMVINTDAGTTVKPFTVISK